MRRAGVDDARGIARVHVESWRSTYAGIVPEAYLQSLDEGARALSWAEQLREGNRPGTMIAFVAEDADGVFGFVCGGKAREAVAGCDAELYAIYLLDEKQGCGAGRGLVLSLASALRREAYQSMLVWVLEENLRAVGFYQHLGGVQMASKTIDIGGISLTELAFGWPSLHSISP